MAEIGVDATAATIFLKAHAKLRKMPAHFLVWGISKRFVVGAICSICTRPMIQILLFPERARIDEGYDKSQRVVD